MKTALPAEEVLDRSEIEHHKFKTQQFNDFKSTIESSSNLKSFDVFDILVEIAKNNNISKEVRDEAIKRVELKQIEGADYN